MKAVIAKEGIPAGKLVLAVVLALSVSACSSDEAAMAVSPEPVAEIATAETVSRAAFGGAIRPEVGGIHGAVVSEHPLASQIGLEVLRNGGNATDAAVAMAAMLAVVRPHMNSIGGDTFALFYDAQTGEIEALNASGRTGQLATPEYYASKGFERMATTGALSVTIPGTVSAWEAALERFGTRSLAESLAPAIETAQNGYMVSATLAADLEKAAPRLNEAGQAVFYPGGHALQEGDLISNPDLANSLRLITEQGAEVMYSGELGRTISSFLEENGSPLRHEDFAAYTPEWTVPASVSFKGYTVHTVRPNSQGIVLLEMLGMLETLDAERIEQNSPEYLHKLVELTRLSFADRDRWVADYDAMTVPLHAFTDKDYLLERMGMIGETASGGWTAGIQYQPDETGTLLNEDGDTVYLMVVDAEGNAVSWVQSLFSSFGSNLMVPGTGIVLQNRGAGFTLEEGHPNQIAPGKRPFHTLMASMVTDAAGDLEMTIGTPGGGGQPQFIAQAIMNTLVYGMSPQAAIEAPRYRINSGLGVMLDERISPAVQAEVAALGHEVESSESWIADFGSLQIIQKLDNQVLRTGADMRREASAMAY